MSKVNSPVVTFHTLGCKLNQAETEVLAGQFVKAGFRVTSNNNADVCILNTCTVTHIADRKSRHLLRLLRKRNPQALIVATGCYAERAPQELNNIGVDLVIDNKQKMNTLNLVKSQLSLRETCSTGDTEIDNHFRVRSFVKIQDGCDDFCTYCIVPLVRGHESCLPAEEIINTIKARVHAGYKEVILTGTKIGIYNHNGINLKQLADRILKETTIPRLHLSSLQPQEISEDFLKLWQDSRLCRHFHVALQSGSNSILKRMGRHYSTEKYKMTVEIIRETVPDVAITTDIMAGFPGESDAEFEESYHFCRDTGFADIHVFSYSARPGTAAAKMSGQVNEKLKKERSLRMLALAKESAQNFQKKFLGQDMAVLWETETSQNTDIYSGLSNNYIRVFTRSPENLTNTISSVRLTRPYRDGLWGELTL
jgi:threonylcarbamoyladenosine tRNA methylthiotransferase MtaB